MSKHQALRHFLPLCALLLCFSLSFALDVTKLESNFDELFSDSRLAENEATNAFVVVVNNGAVAFQKGYGVIDTSDLTAKPHSQSLYPLGALSKTFIAVSATQLTEQGKLDSSLSVNSLLDKYNAIFKLDETIYGNYDSWSKLPSKKSPFSVTVQNLFSQTAGFDEYPDIFLNSASKQTFEEYLKEHLPPLIRTPGLVSTDSNHGAAIVALLVELISKLDYSSYVKKNIFDVLMMNSTYAALTADLLKDPNFIKPLKRSGNSYTAVDNWGQYQGLPPVTGALSCAEDLKNFVLALLNNGKADTVIPGATENLLQSTNALFETTFSHNLPYNQSIARFWLKRSYNEVPYMYYAGDILPYRSRIALFPEHNTGVLILSVGQNAQWSDALDATLKVFIAKHIKDINCQTPPSKVDGKCYEEIPDTQIRPETDFSKRAKQYVGTYIFWKYPHTRWLKILSLSQPSMTISYKDGNRFLMASVPGVDYYLLETEEPGVFRIASPNGAQVYAEVGNNDIYKFLWTTEANKDKGLPADYLIRNVDYVMERFDDPKVIYMMIGLAVIFVATICITLGHVIYVVAEFFNTNRKVASDKSTYNQIDRLESMLEPLSEGERAPEVVVTKKKKTVFDDEEMEQDFIETYEPGIKAKKKHKANKKSRSKKSRTLSVGTRAVLMVFHATASFVLLLVGLLNLFHLGFMVIHWQFINPTKLFPQDTLTIVMVIPSVSVAVQVVAGLAIIAMVIMRCIKCTCWGFFMILLQVVIFGFNFIYYPFLIYFNWFAPAFA